jgi:hypothetical protein
MAVAAFVSIGCADDPYFDGSPEVADRAPDGREWRHLQTVREFGPAQRLAPADVRMTRRIIARDPSLAPLLHDAGGHTVSALGPFTTDGALIGAATEVRLASPITGTYQLPAACAGDGIIPVGPSELRFNGVNVLDVQVGFADHAVFEVQPVDGDYAFTDDDPGTWPQSCRDTAEQTVGE